MAGRGVRRPDRVRRPPRNPVCRAAPAPRGRPRGLAAHRTAARVRLRGVGRRPRPRVRPGLVALCPARRPLRRRPRLARLYAAAGSGTAIGTRRCAAWAPPKPRCCATGGADLRRLADDGRAEHHHPGRHQRLPTPDRRHRVLRRRGLRLPRRRRRTDLSGPGLREVDAPCGTGSCGCPARCCRPGRSRGPRPTCCWTAAPPGSCSAPRRRWPCSPPILRAAGAKRVVALTHGSEAWWTKLPPTRALLRRIGDDVDALSTNSDFVQAEFAPALSAAARTKLFRLSPPVDLTLFRPDPTATDGATEALRRGRSVRPAQGFRRAAAQLVDRAPAGWPAAEPPPEFVLVGDGPYSAGRCYGWPRRPDRRPGAVHRRAAADRRSRRSCSAPTCSRCRSGPGGSVWNPRASGWRLWRRPAADSRSWSAIPAVRRRPCRTAVPGTSSTLVTRRARDADRAICCSTRSRPTDLGRRGPRVRGRPVRVARQPGESCAPHCGWIGCRYAGPVADQTSADIDVAAPPEQVMAVIADFESYPAWVDSMKSATVLTKAPGRTGRDRPDGARPRPGQGRVHAGVHLAAQHRELEAGRGQPAQGHGRLVRAAADRPPVRR